MGPSLIVRTGVSGAGSWRGRLRLAGAAALVAGLTAGTATSPAVAEQSAAASPSGSGQTAGAGIIRPWALQNEQGGYDVPQSEAVQDASRHQLITAHKFAYGGDVPAMREANPGVFVYAYVNATFAQADEGSKYPAAWYALDAQGRRVQNRNTGNFMMDPGHEGWILNRINECRTRITTLGYHGCSLDVLGLAPLSGSFVTTPAVNPRTRAAWTKVDWINATANLARRVNLEMDKSGWVTIGNGLSTGALYFDRANPTKRLLDVMHGGMAEAWLRGASVGVNTYRSESAWKKDVDMLVSAEAAGKPILTLTKMWVASATQAQKDTWRKYSLASYLLGANGRSYFYFSDGFSASRTAGHPWYQTDIGTPTGAYGKVGSVYSRSFTRGRSMVNPSLSTVTVPVSGTWRTIDGRTVSGSVTLQPNGSEILVAP